MMSSLFFAVVGTLALGANANMYRLALFEGESTGCQLETIGQTIRYFTIKPTTTCTELPDSAFAWDSDATPKYYYWSEETGKECFKAGCDSRCRSCQIHQGVCSGSSGSGSGGTTTRPHVVESDVESVMSDELVTCGSTISGETSYPGLSFMGNPTPDRLHTLLIEKATTVHIDGCGADFETSIKVFSTDEEDGSDPVMSCKGCDDCSEFLEAGEYALLVEGDETQVRTSGAFSINVDCGAARRARAEPLPALEDSSAPVAVDTCYKNFFIFSFNKDSEETCVLEQPSLHVSSSIKLNWVGMGNNENSTCDARSDSGSTIVASVVGDTGICAPDGSSFSSVKKNGSKFDVKFDCVLDDCSQCSTHENNVGAGECINHKYEVMPSSSFHVCNGGGPTPMPEKKKGAPVGAIVGSIIGALVVGGVVFFVIRRRKQKQSTAYAVLQDDPTF